MSNAPPAGFVDFVVARGPALHRTAVLLTRQEQSADHGDGVSSRQVLMAALATLPPRQRAVVVLRFFHDYTEAATAPEGMLR